MKNTITSLFVLCCGLAFFMGCSNDASDPVEIGANEITEETADEITVSESQFELAKMQLGQLTEHEFPTVVKVTGMVDVPIKNHASVSAYAGGYVKSIGLIPGEKVKKRQVLFTLENPEFVQMQQDYLEAKEQLAYLKSDYERQQTLANENIASQKNFLKAESDYRVTLAKMEGMKKRLSLLNISTDKISAQNLVSSISVFAPVSGYVTEVNAMRGMYLNPTDMAVKILDTDHLHIELNVFEKDILKIKEGQQIRFRIPDADPKIYEATVHLVGKTVDEENRVIRIHGHLKNEKDIAFLVPGMYVDAEIITTMNKTKGLPESAIVSEDGQEYVLVSKGKKGNMNVFEKRAVTVGESKNGLVQIVNSDAFAPNEKILVEGAFNLIGIE